MALAVAIYMLWRKYLIGPRIKVIERMYLSRGSHHVIDHDLPVAWTWRLRIRNDGSQSGTIRKSHLGIFEIQPENMNPPLEISWLSHHIDDSYPTGNAKELMFRIGYIDLTRSSLLEYERIRKLTVMLKFEKEERTGFTSDIMRFKLIPEPDKD